MAGTRAGGINPGDRGCLQMLDWRSSEELACGMSCTAPRPPFRAHFGDGSCLSGLVGLVGLAGSGPLDSEAFGPPGVVAGTLPCVRGRSAGVAPGPVPVAALPLDPGAVDVPGVVVWARAIPALVASRSAAIVSLMKELRCCSL